MNVIEHLLMKTTKEAGEVAQMAGKCRIFGVENRNSECADQSNIELLIAETNDLLAIIEMLGDQDISIAMFGNREHIALKRKKVKVWMEHARNLGTLTSE